MFWPRELQWRTGTHNSCMPKSVYKEANADQRVKDSLRNHQNNPEVRTSETGTTSEAVGWTTCWPTKGQAWTNCPAYSIHVDLQLQSSLFPCLYPYTYLGLPWTNCTQTGFVDHCSLLAYPAKSPSLADPKFTVLRSSNNTKVFKKNKHKRGHLVASGRPKAGPSAGRPACRHMPLDQVPSYLLTLLKEQLHGVFT